MVWIKTKSLLLKKTEIDIKKTSIYFLLLSLVVVFSAHVLSPLDHFQQSFQLFLGWHIGVQRQHFRAQVFFSDSYVVMVTSRLAMVAFVEAALVVGIVVFAFILPPEMEDSFTFMASAVFGSMMAQYLSSIRNQGVVLLRLKDMRYYFFASMKMKGLSNHGWYKSSLMRPLKHKKLLIRLDIFFYKIWFTERKDKVQPSWGRFQRGSLLPFYSLILIVTVTV